MKLYEKSVSFGKCKKYALIMLIALFSIFSFDSSNEAEASTLSKSLIQVNPIYPNYFFEGIKVKTSDEEGLYKYGGNYLPSALNYKNAIYVPIEFVTKHTNYSLIYDSGDIYLGVLEDYDQGEFKEVIVSGEPVEEEQNLLTYDDDFTFFGIDPYDNIDDSLKKLNFKNMSVQHDNGQTYITDSVYTDTSFFMTLNYDDRDNITGMYYEDFGVKLRDVKNLNDYLKKQPSIKTSRGLVVPGSKMSDVMKLYGKNPDVSISYAPNSDKEGLHLISDLLKAFKPALDYSDIEVEMKPNWLPSKEDTIKYITTTYTFEYEGYEGTLSFFSSAKNGENLKNAVVYGFEYDLN